MEAPCVPPGFRFHPTDEELVGYYLRKKVASEKIDLDVIRDVDLYRLEPWDLQERCRIGYEEQTEWYFFSHKDKKYPTGTRTNRATAAGFWKATGRDKAVVDRSRLIGMRKTLVFYRGRAPNGQKTDWIMHEYRLESEENAPPQEEGWVVCRAFKKRAVYQTRTAEAWEPTYEEMSGGRPDGVFCKQELADFAGPFSQLPQLGSPSVPAAAKPLGAARENEEDDQARGGSGEPEPVTDWRALDRLIASQLSQEGGGGSRLGEFLRSTVGCDQAILCLLEK
ncbi:unnamed protein product [Spirodela intermedia]|uniref:NAC domain-containing protein n=1 Tax=Spirodela intermedia TaxID=51605 RepID=A0A7I8K435_SPIIN|nr:unnamed protein product [Spirodela intermedia]